MFPYASFGNCKNLYKYSKENGVAFVYAEGQAFAKHSTAFATFRCYLHSKFGWNVNYDFDALKEKFFAKVYGSQSKTMLRVFEKVMARLAKQTGEMNIETWSTQTLDFEKAKFWDFDEEKYCIETIEDAQIKLNENGEKLSSSLARLEELSPLYIVLKLFKDKIDEKRYETYLKRFESYMREFEIDWTGQGETFDECLAEFNKNLNEKRGTINA